MRALGTAVVSVLLLASSSFAQQPPAVESVIDMHLHALPAGYYGPPPTFICAPYDEWPAWDPKTGGLAYADKVAVHPPCAHPLKSGLTDDAVMQDTLHMLGKYNIIAVTNGEGALLDKWKTAGGKRILPATYLNKASAPTIEALREQVKTQGIVAFAEVGSSTSALPRMILLSNRCTPWRRNSMSLSAFTWVRGLRAYRTSVTNATACACRVCFCWKMSLYGIRSCACGLWHAGWPLADDTIAALYAHPQLYVDLGVIDYTTPKAEFYVFLKRLVDAGFENRIMFGSDQMLWPDAIPIAIANIQNAPFLSAKQKRDILYNNAARFLRLTQ